jgi:transcriptional regulator with XRE-family HTH domain
MSTKGERDMTTYRKFEHVLADSLADPEVHAEWERTALARELSIWLIRYRQHYGLTQTTLAKQLAWRQPMVARLERADHEPSIATLQYLGVQLGLRTKIDIDGDEVRVRLLNGAPLARRHARPVTVAAVRKQRAAPKREQTKRRAQSKTLEPA